jgi:uncharacterized protein YndB with AHSA1/START domain
VGGTGVYTTESWKADVRTGGDWSLVTRLPDGTARPASGHFILVDAPAKVVQSRRYDWDHPTLGRRVTKVTTLLASPSGTRTSAAASTPTSTRAAGNGSSTGFACI